MDYQKCYSFPGSFCDPVVGSSKWARKWGVAIVAVFLSIRSYCSSILNSKRTL